MSKPYCGIHKVPKGRERGTSEYCIKSGQARYYGINSVEDVIDVILAEKRKVANEKAKIKRQDAKIKRQDAMNKVKDAKKAVEKANKAENEANLAEKQSMNVKNNKPKPKPKPKAKKS